MLDETSDAPTGRWRRRPGWVHRALTGQVVLAAPGGGQRTVEGLAAAVWLVLDEPGDDVEIAARLDGVVGLSSGQVGEALAALADHGLVEPVPAGEESVREEPHGHDLQRRVEGGS